MAYDLTTYGWTKLEPEAFRVILCPDFNKYYRWHIMKATYNCLAVCLPKHGNHITITNQKLHGNKFNFNYLKQYDGIKIQLNYDPYIYTGGRGFTNFWLKFNLPLGNQIKKELGIVENGFLGFHATVCSTKQADNYVDKSRKLG
jgi:hypothetical protein